MAEDYVEIEEWARSIRRKMANWDFIEKQPPRIKQALKYLVEKGDLRVAAKLAGLTVDEMADVAKKAKIPSGP